MSKSDYYDTIGVSKNASADELKRAYRKKAMEYHPDRNPGDNEAEQKFKNLNEAYEVLKDDQKRAAYDQYGHAAFEQGGMGGGGRSGGFEFNFGGGSFGDIFEDVFNEFMGGGSGRRRASRGADARYDMTISLEEAFTGKSTKIKIKTAVECDKCDGFGTKNGKEPGTCSTCNGMGKVRMQQGFFAIERPCPTCGGTGTEIKEPCEKCHGAGRVEKEKSLEVKIPAGIENGTRIRLADEGHAGTNGAPAGDLYIFLNVKEHDIFTRVGNDIHCDVPISMITAALGGCIDVPTIGGNKEEIKIPVGTQTDREFRIRNKGMSVLHSKSKGDMFVNVTVETPVNLSKKQKELLREFGEEKGDCSPLANGFFQNVKNLWDNLTDQ
ncbi:MAG: molecular chaperone DnaJ [Alphaproteobacteria bacterium]|nr:molecular chaperone DnaJ [Alphaproteobacteria bacterium]